MKKIIFSLLVLSMGFAVQAQDVKKDDRSRMKHHKGMMTEKLNLTDAQKAQMKTVNEDYKSKMTELKKNENITVKDMKSKKSALHKEHSAKVKSILTSEQLQQIEKMKTERKMNHEADGKKRMESMKTRLGLTDAQTTQLEKNKKEMGEKMKALRENKTLDESAKKEQFKALQKEQMEKMKSVLTEDQIKKLKEGRKQRPDKKSKSV
jgi:hypothetical protein